MAGKRTLNERIVEAHVAGRIRSRRIAIGLTQQQLADASGVTFQQMQKYEKGQNRVGAARLLQIATALDVPVGWFFDGLDQPTEPPGEMRGLTVHMQNYAVLTPEQREIVNALTRMLAGLTANAPFLIAA